MYISLLTNVHMSHRSWESFFKTGLDKEAVSKYI